MHLFILIVVYRKLHPQKKIYHLPKKKLNRPHYDIFLDNVNT